MHALQGCCAMRDFMDLDLNLQRRRAEIRLQLTLGVGGNTRLATLRCGADVCILTPLRSHQSEFLDSRGDVIVEDISKGNGFIRQRIRDFRPDHHPASPGVNKQALFCRRRS